jgi:formylglycine-generating enzyme required for sulfatase activity
MKSLIIAMFLGLMMVGCGEQAQKEAVEGESDEKNAQVEAKDDWNIPMAIPCEVCEKKVSKRSTSCPNCGHPTPASVVAYKEAQELARIRAERERELAAIRAEEERKRQELITKRVKPLIEKRENFITDSKLEMLWVKPGTFMMGSPKGEAKRDEDEIQHQVTLTKGFYLGKYEVTQAQWGRVMGNNPSRFKGADRPVEQVSWNDAVEFCKKLTEIETKAGRVPQGMSYQLPTEAQWEYACRAGTTTKYSWGDDINPKLANYEDSGLWKTMAVGSYRPNPWGFCDMHGNVWELCADWYGEYPTSSVTDPIGVALGSDRVKRGGSFNWSTAGWSLVSANRSTTSPGFPGNHYHYYGFRVSFQSSK